MKQVFLAACVCLLAIPYLGCKKSGSSKSKTELLAQAVWKYENAALDTDRNGTADAPLPAGFIQPCEMDNLITFKNDNTGLVDEGPTKCNGGSPQSVPFTWSFKDNEQVITFTGITFGGLNGDVKVKTLNENQLELHKEVNVGMVVNVIVYLKH
ncbi:MAG TPA: lipocalin family protein [Chitinophagaceae bacterium]